MESNVIAEEVVTSLGLVPKRMPAAARQTMYLAGTDEERAADLNAAFRDRSVDAIWCIRGGYGSGRLLPLLDWDAIRKNPKPLLGYSDITALLNGIHAKTGLVTFHAPNCSENISEYSLAELKRVAFSTEPAGVVAAAPPVEPKEGFVDREDRLRRIVPGTGRGRLVGGNISVFSMLVGTPFEPPLAGSILFLEEVGEEPYRIDRWLTQFALTGRLSKCAGIVFGKFKDCVPPDKGSFQGTWTWQEVVESRFGRLGVPILTGLRFGHVTDKSTLPVGALAELDVEKGTLTLLEPAVS
jgi:muramoyltetrapeptide carboxypeptidase